MMKRLSIGSLMCSAIVMTTLLTPARGQEVVKLWPGDSPGPAAQVKGPETDMTKESDGKPGGKPVQRIGNVAQPEIHVYRAEKPDPSGAACVICPGGGFNILAWDLEGTEVAQWFNERGVTAVVLKYRVPTSGHGDDQRFVGPVYDAQRAIRYTRAHAKEWGVNPDHIGVLGFSAGGLTAGLAAIAGGEAKYEPVDEIDRVSAKADFAMLIYTAYMADEEGRLQSRFSVSDKSPPTFLVHAYDDRVTPLTSTALFTALKLKGVPVELHVYSTGGHGYGMRENGTATDAWPAAADAWLKGQKLVSEE